MAALDPILYTDAKLRRILSTVRTIAMVGASSNWNRPSYFVMNTCKAKATASSRSTRQPPARSNWARKFMRHCANIPDSIDMVDVFRASDQVGPVVDDAIRHWRQSGLDAVGCA